MTRHVALDNVAHQSLRVALRHGATFGDQVNQMVVLPTEFEEVQREFPILLRKTDAGEMEALALLGLDRDENLFFDGERWTSRYIPALQQRGPFSIGLPGDDAPADLGPTVHVDLDDPRVGDEAGELLFLPHGGAGRYLEHVSRVLSRLHAGIAMAQQLYPLLDRLGLIEPTTIEVMLNDEQRYKIEGFHILSRERLDGLTVGAIEQLHGMGGLAHAYWLAGSLGNVPALIERKNARIAAR
ncbi:SapC family protein [Sphingomonas sp. RS6]